MAFLSTKEKIDQWIEEGKSEPDSVVNEYEKLGDGHYNRHVIEQYYQESRNIIESTDASGITGFSEILDPEYILAQTKVILHKDLRREYDLFD